MAGISIFQEELGIRILMQKKQKTKQNSIWKCWQLILKLPHEFKRNYYFFFRYGDSITYFS